MKKDYKVGEKVKCVQQPHGVVNHKLAGNCGVVVENDTQYVGLNLIIDMGSGLKGEWYMDYEDVEPLTP